MSERNRRILVIDDDDDIREGMLDALEDEGYQPVGCRDGRAALTELRCGGPRPGLIFLDWYMPAMDGAEFCRQRALDPALAEIPVVVLSADRRVHAEVSDLTNTDYLDKPVALDDVLEVAARHAGK